MKFEDTDDNWYCPKSHGNCFNKGRNPVCLYKLLCCWGLWQQSLILDTIQRLIFLSSRFWWLEVCWLYCAGSVSQLVVSPLGHFASGHFAPIYHNHLHPHQIVIKSAFVKKKKIFNNMIFETIFTASFLHYLYLFMFISWQPNLLLNRHFIGY